MPARINIDLAYPRRMLRLAELTARTYTAPLATPATLTASKGPAAGTVAASRIVDAGNGVDGPSGRRKYGVVGPPAAIGVATQARHGALRPLFAHRNTRQLGAP